MKGSLIIIGFFILGIIFGVTDIIPAEALEGNISLYALCALMFCVGVSIGNDPNSISSFKQLPRRLTLLPIATILGTWAALVVVNILLDFRTTEQCYAVGSGFGYYSLSSIFITEYMGAELGTLALLTNIARELLTLLAAPLLVKYFGPLSLISAGGATTMDTVLPSVIRYSGKKYAILSIYQGFVVDFSVPFMVTFFCTI
ncbi:MAG: lysine exporter LysO family protein [Bacteroidaceae bacterium]|nr:lysine exporter LysO family protein [Bacteroidaceae bacterium]